MPPFSFHQIQLRMHSKVAPLVGDGRDLALACDWPTLSARPCILRCKSWPHAALPGCGWPRIILGPLVSARLLADCRAHLRVGRRLSVLHKRSFVSVSACETVCVESIARVLHRVGCGVLPLAHTRAAGFLLSLP